MSDEKDRQEQSEQCSELLGPNCHIKRLGRLLLVWLPTKAATSARRPRTASSPLSAAPRTADARSATGSPRCSSTATTSGSAQRAAGAVTAPTGSATNRLAEADRLLAYALTICQYGERAPGGTENWRQFAIDAEAHLRAAL